MVSWLDDYFSSLIGLKVFFKNNNLKNVKTHKSIEKNDKNVLLKGWNVNDNDIFSLKVDPHTFATCVSLSLTFIHFLS